MYLDSKKQWNVIVGCKFHCIYCEKSFQAQMKRQKHNCIKCYNYEPHFHEDRLSQTLPKTHGDEFIWCCSSSDIYFAKKEWMERILERIIEMPNRTFFFQTKEPSVFYDYDFPKNVLLGITLESNRFYEAYYDDAPEPYVRFKGFYDITHPRKIITIEPVLEFDFSIFLRWIKKIQPERIYIGFDTKNTVVWNMESDKYETLCEPSIEKTKSFIRELERFTKVKTKYMKGRV